MYKYMYIYIKVSNWNFYFTCNIFINIHRRFVLRYKMICKKTWPNPSGTDKDGTHEILKSQNRAGDVTYGNTKVFIKSPETIFELEEAR